MSASCLPIDLTATTEYLKTTGTTDNVERASPAKSKSSTVAESVKQFLFEGPGAGDRAHHGQAQGRHGRNRTQASRELGRGTGGRVSYAEPRDNPVGRGSLFQPNDGTAPTLAVHFAWNKEPR